MNPETLYAAICFTLAGGLMTIAIVAEVLGQIRQERRRRRLARHLASLEEQRRFPGLRRVK